MRTSVEAAAFLGMGGYLTGELMGSAAALGEAGVSSAGTYTSILETIGTNDGLQQVQAHILEAIMKWTGSILIMDLSIASSEM